MFSKTWRRKHTVFSLHQAASTDSPYIATESAAGWWRSVTNAEFLAAVERHSCCNWYLSAWYQHIIHTYIRTYVHTYIQTYILTLPYLTLHYITLQTYIHTYRQTDIHTHIHSLITYIHAYIHTCMHTYIHICIYAYSMYKHKSINKYVYIYISRKWCRHQALNHPCSSRSSKSCSDYSSEKRSRKQFSEGLFHLKI